VRARQRLPRLLGEGLVIFLGAALALFADDWRESRAEREEVQQSLRAMYDDLASDSIELIRLGASAQADANDALWLLSRWGDAGVHPDSIVQHVKAFRTSPRPQFRRAAFQGLRTQNRLRLIENTDLRELILDYYEGLMPRLEGYFNERVRARYGDVNRSLEPHLSVFAAATGGSISLRSDWDAIRVDYRVEHGLLGFNRAADLIGRWAPSGADQVAGLRSAISAELGLD
jgi:hypothetical protein